MRGVVAQVLLGLVAVAAAPRSKPYNSRRTNVGREHDMTPTLGYCAATRLSGSTGGCDASERSGSWLLPGSAFNSWASAFDSCARLCAACSACRNISISLRWHDCSWYHSCPVTQSDVIGHYSFAVPHDGSLAVPANVSLQPLPTDQDHVYDLYDEPLRSYARPVSARCPRQRVDVCPAQATGAHLQLMAVGKTGSSTLEEMLEECDTAFGRVQALSHEHDISMRALRDCDSTSSLIFSVRAPISRLLSAWRENRFQEHRAGFRFQDNNDLFRTPNELGCALGSDDDGLAAAAEASMLHSYHIRNNLASYLVSPQFLRDTASGRIFHVLRAEHTDADLAELMARLWPANASLALSAANASLAPSTRRKRGRRKGTCPGEGQRVQQASPTAASTIIHRRISLNLSHGGAKVLKYGTLSRSAFERFLQHPLVVQDYELIDFLAGCGFVPAGYAQEVRALDRSLVRDELSCTADLSTRLLTPNRRIVRR